MQRIEQIQSAHDDTVSRLEETSQAFDREKTAMEDSMRQREVIEQELRSQLAQIRQEYDTMAADLEQRALQLEQQRIGYEDEQDKNRLRMQELQQHIEQLTQDGKTIAARLVQQKKFYDEERELRRQKEVELMQQKKALQDVQTLSRQKEQTFTHQKKLHDDELVRARQKEETLLRRIEQLQKDWRSAAGRLEQVNKEAAIQRKDVAVRFPRATPEDPAARRAAVPDTRKSIVPADISMEDAEPQEILRSMEMKAQAELETWQRMQTVRKPVTPVVIEKREPAPGPGKIADLPEKSGPPADSSRGALPGDPQKPKERFKVRPWISLK